MNGPWPIITLTDNTYCFYLNQVLIYKLICPVEQYNIQPPTITCTRGFTIATASILIDINTTRISNMPRDCYEYCILQHVYQIASSQHGQIQQLIKHKWAGYIKGSTHVASYRTSCPTGYSLSHGICIPCGPGTRSVDSLRCQACPRTSYQSHYAQHFCVSCPNQTRTTYTGATTKQECVFRHLGRNMVVGIVKTSLKTFSIDLPPFWESTLAVLLFCVAMLFLSCLTWCVLFCRCWMKFIIQYINLMIYLFYLI